LRGTVEDVLLCQKRRVKADTKPWKCEKVDVYLFI